MKLVAPFFTMLTIFLYFSIQQNSIVGKYKMEFEEKYNSHNCYVNFENDKYERKLIDGKIVKGKIDNLEKKIILTDENTFLQMEFFKRELSNDTVYFKTKNLKEEHVPKKGIVIYSGKLIRIK